jgi:outer membrane protein assembly factor BamB
MGPAAAEMIDLGDADWSLDKVPGPGLSRRSRHWLIVVGLVLLILFAGAAAAPGRPSFGTPLWTEKSYGYFDLYGDTVYTVDTVAHAVTARVALTGAQIWQRRFDGASPQVTALPDGLVAVVLESNGYGNDPPPSEIVDAATGASVRTIAGTPYGPIAGSSAVLFGLAAPDCAADYTPCLELAAVHPRTGEVDWKILQTSETQLILDWSRSDGLSTLALMDNKGKVTVHDLHTGGLVTTYTVAGWEDHSFGQLQRGIGVAGDMLVAVIEAADNVAPGTATVTAYRTLTGQQLWSTSIRLHVASADRRYLFAGMCGPYLCIHDGTGSTALDLSGHIGFSIADAQVTSAAYGNLLLAWKFETEQPYITSIDTQNGRTGPVVYGDALVNWPDPAGRALVTSAGKSRTDLVLIDPSGTSQLLGTLDGRGWDCSAGDVVLACRTGERLSVWALPKQALPPQAQAQQAGPD